MAVAAYASLLSLSHVLDNIQHPSRHRLLPNTKQIQTLHEKVHFLQQFLEFHSRGESEQIEDLARQIAEVANEAEEIIDSHVVDRLFQEHEDKTDDDIFPEDIDKVIEKIDSIKEELLLTMAKAEGKVFGEQRFRISVPAAAPSTLRSGGKNIMVGFDEHLVGIMDELTGNQSKGSVAAGPSRLLFSGKNTHVVGFDEHLVRIMDQLTREQPDLQIIPIVGMGGIGKTTLARIVFENKYVVRQSRKTYNTSLSTPS